MASTTNTAAAMQLGGRGVLSIEPNALSAPLSVLIEVTSRCNLKCRHCMMNAEYDGGEGRARNELTLAELKSLVDQWADMGVFHIDLSGGEPLLREDIFDLAAYAYSKKVESCLLTNGTLIDDEMARRIKQSHILKVETNLDGPNAEIYDRFRGVPGAFERTIGAIAALVEHQVPLRLNVMFAKCLVPHFEACVDLAGRLGAKEVCLAPVRIAGQVVGNYDELVLTPNEYAETMPLVMDLKMKMEEKYGLQLLFIGDADATRFVDPANMFPSCGAGRLHCTLGADGWVRPCPAFPAAAPYLAGNVREKDFGAIWTESDIFRKLRDPEIPGCSNCKRRNCVGGCRVQALWKHGDLLGGPDPFCEEQVSRRVREVLAAGPARS